MCSDSEEQSVVLIWRIQHKSLASTTGPYRAVGQNRPDRTRVSEYDYRLYPLANEH